MPFNAVVFTLRSKVELNWTRAIQHVIAQSVQFSKIAKKLNIDLCQFFSHRKEAMSFINPFAPEPPVTARADPGPFYPL